MAASDIDADMGGGRALLHVEYGVLDLVSCTEAHLGLLAVADGLSIIGELLEGAEGCAARGQAERPPLGQKQDKQERSDDQEDRAENREAEEQPTHQESA